MTPLTEKRYAGIAWTETGYRVEVLDSSGRRVTEPRDWGAARVTELIAWLREFDGGPVPAVVLDSTNGLLDGPMTAAGLEVYRADPGSFRPGRASAPSRPDSSRNGPWPHRANWPG